MKKICVLGLGYIGLPTAAFLAHAGYDVRGVDIDGRVNDMHKSSKTTVVARNLSKSYFLNKQGSQFNLFGHKRVDEVQALKPISFRAQTGESIGLVGQNGSGKSTLLRLISGAESPTSGDAFVSSVPTLLGVSSALQNDLPGKANIRLGLLAMGLSFLGRN